MKQILVRVGLLVAALFVGTQFFYSRELMVMFLLFALAFATLTLVILILFLLDQGLYRGLLWAAPYAVRAGLRFRPNLSQIKDLGRKLARRPEHQVGS